MHGRSNLRGPTPSGTSGSRRLNQGGQGSSPTGPSSPLSCLSGAHWHDRRECPVPAGWPGGTWRGSSDRHGTSSFLEGVGGHGLGRNLEGRTAATLGGMPIHRRQILG